MGHPREKARAHGWSQSRKRAGAGGAATPLGLGLDAECLPGPQNRSFFRNGVFADVTTLRWVRARLGWALNPMTGVS